MEHDVERLLLALQILHVVDEQHVCFLIAGLEVLVARLLLVVCGACLHVVGEQFCRIDVDGAEPRHRFVHVVLDGT